MVSCCFGVNHDKVRHMPADIYLFIFVTLDEENICKIKSQNNFITIIIIAIIIIIIIIIIITIELTHSKTIPEISVEIKPQSAALDFKNLSQYSSRSK